MDAATASPHPCENRLLACLPPATYDRLAPHLDPLPLALRQPLAEPTQPIAYVYFPRTAVVSLLTAAAGDPAVEIATIGNEGMVGLAIFLGTTRAWSTAQVQIPGEAVRIRAGDVPSRGFGRPPRGAGVVQGQRAGSVCSAL